MAQFLYSSLKTNRLWLANSFLLKTTGWSGIQMTRTNKIWLSSPKCIKRLDNAAPKWEMFKVELKMWAIQACLTGITFPLKWNGEKRTLDRGNPGRAVRLLRSKEERPGPNWMNGKHFCYSAACCAARRWPRCCASIRDRSGSVNWCGSRWAATRSIRCCGSRTWRPWTVAWPSSCASSATAWRNCRPTKCWSDWPPGSAPTTPEPFIATRSHGTDETRMQLAYSAVASGSQWRATTRWWRAEPRSVFLAAHWLGETSVSRSWVNRGSFSWSRSIPYFHDVRPIFCVDFLFQFLETRVAWDIAARGSREPVSETLIDFKRTSLFLFNQPYLDKLTPSHPVPPCWGRNGMLVFSLFGSVA